MTLTTNGETKIVRHQQKDLRGSFPAIRARTHFSECVTYIPSRRNETSMKLDDERPRTKTNNEQQQELVTKVTQSRE